MVSISVKGISNVNISKKFLEKVRNDVRKNLNINIDAVADQVANRVAKLFVSKLRSHPVIQSLNGAYAGDESGNDLPAELGLPPEIASLGASFILDTVYNSVEAMVSQEQLATRKNIQIKVRLLSEYRDILLSNSGGRYTSSPSGEEIRWMEWLLVLHRVAIPADQAAIVFDTSPGNRSRSGRAYMLNLENKTPQIRAYLKSIATRHPYVFAPRMVMPKGNAEDFIAAEFNDPTFQKEAKGIITTALRSRKVKAGK